MGRLPYPGVQLVSLLQLLEDGHRLARPTNTACSGDMYVYYVIYDVVDSLHQSTCVRT